MIWAHSGRMHWTSNDIKGVTMSVLQNEQAWWQLVTPMGVTTYTHPLQAMNAGRQLMEQINAKQEEEARSASSASTPEASGAV